MTKPWPLDADEATTLEREILELEDIQQYYAKILGDRAVELCDKLERRFCATNNPAFHAIAWHVLCASPYLADDNDHFAYAVDAITNANADAASAYIPRSLAKEPTLLSDLLAGAGEQTT
jgi:hypothetical protein